MSKVKDNFKKKKGNLRHKQINDKRKEIFLSIMNDCI